MVVRLLLREPAHFPGFFDWGTYFGGAAPTAYYKAKAPTEEAALRTFVNTAGEELKAMSQKFTAPEGKKTIIPIKLELYTPADPING